MHYRVRVRSEIVIDEPAGWLAEQGANHAYAKQADEPCDRLGHSVGWFGERSRGRVHQTDLQSFDLCSRGQPGWGGRPSPFGRGPPDPFISPNRVGSTLASTARLKEGLSCWTAHWSMWLRASSPTKLCWTAATSSSDHHSLYANSDAGPSAPKARSHSRSTTRTKAISFLVPSKPSALCSADVGDGRELGIRAEKRDCNGSHVPPAFHAEAATVSATFALRAPSSSGRPVVVSVAV